MMIKIKIFRQTEGKISSFSVTGHSGTAEHGEDIVCAAVSVLSINTINSLEKLAGVVLEKELDDLNGGFMKVSVDDSDLDDPKVQLLLESLELGLRDIEISYHEYIHVK